MPIKDKEKKRKATREAMQRYRDKRKGITQGITSYQKPNFIDADGNEIPEYE